MLQQQIKDQLKEAMLAKDTLRVSVLRGLIAGFTNELVTQKKKPQEEISDDDALNVIKKSVKQRKESIEQFTKGKRMDLAEKERAELAMLEKYLPEMMGKEDIEKIANSKIQELGITDKSKIGILIGSLMKELGNRANGADVKDVAEKLLK